jgi:transposase
MCGRARGNFLYRGGLGRAAASFEVGSDAFKSAHKKEVAKKVFEVFLTKTRERMCTECTKQAKLRHTERAISD